MLTELRIKNFRQIEDQRIDLSQAVVIVGPNNGGKTSVLQAISLFSIAVRLWGEQRINKNSSASKRTGVAISFDNLKNIPISEFREIWRNLSVREGIKNKQGKPTAKNIKIEIHAKGFTKNISWETGFEFDYGRDNLIYARLASDEQGVSFEYPEILQDENIGYLPSVAGLNPIEDKLEVGSILRNIGDGDTARVLRNICFLLYERDIELWNEFKNEIEELFKIQVNAPKYFPNTGLLKMTYNEGAKKDVDLSSVGSGAKQAILMFAYILAFPNTINLLDEPDAHLEVIRQSNIYDKITNYAKKNNSQVIIASHSESVLNRAFPKDKVISVVFGELEEVTKTKYIQSVLRNYGYEEFITARQKPYILYFEGTTDFDFLKAYCKLFQLSIELTFIETMVFPYPVGNNSAEVKKHFSSLKQFIPNLKAFALFDNLNREEDNVPHDLLIRQWKRREIENYIPLPQTIYKYVESQNFEEPLFNQQLVETIHKIVEDKTPPAALKDLNDRFWITTKISDDYLTPIFSEFFDKHKKPRGIMDKSKYYQLVDYIHPESLNGEVRQILTEIFDHFNYKNS